MAASIWCHEYETPAIRRYIYPDKALTIEKVSHVDEFDDGHHEVTTSDGQFFYMETGYRWYEEDSR